MNINDGLDIEFDRQLKAIMKPNLMVVGGTGVGKSSLVNTVFGKEVAEVGSGRPVTKGCKAYEQENFPVVVFDTEGYEINQGQIDNSNFQKEVVAEIERRRALDLKDQIHIFWYCIAVSSHRITDYDIENINRLNKLGSRLAVVFTKCDEDELNDANEGVNATAFRQVLAQKGIKNKVFETASEWDDKLDLDDLIAWSSENLPDDALKDAWIGAQKSNISLKDQQATSAIKWAMAAASTAGGVNPLPLSDAAIIVPIQMALAARLANIYGFGLMGSSVTALIKAQVLSLVGRQMAASLTKMIPVLGQFINAAVAGVITGGIGYALMALYRKAYVEMLENGKTPDWAKLFSKLDMESMIREFKSKGGVDSL